MSSVCRQRATFFLRIGQGTFQLRNLHLGVFFLVLLRLDFDSTLLRQALVVALGREIFGLGNHLVAVELHVPLVGIFGLGDLEVQFTERFLEVEAFDAQPLTGVLQVVHQAAGFGFRLQEVQFQALVFEFQKYLAFLHHITAFGHFLGDVAAHDGVELDGLERLHDTRHDDELIEFALADGRNRYLVLLNVELGTFVGPDELVQYESQQQRTRHNVPNALGVPEFFLLPLVHAGLAEGGVRHFAKG